MNIFKKYIFAFAIIATLLIPQMAVAQNIATPTIRPPATSSAPNSAASQSAQCEALKNQFQNAGGGNVLEGIPTYCTPGAVFKKFLNFALYAIAIVTVIAIIYGGYLYMTARGNAEQSKKARTVLTWAIIGLIVVLLATVIVNVIIRLLVENRFV